MADIVAAAVRSRMMAGIRSRNTKPELIVRKGLHALGFRFKLHEKKLPGRPDIVLSKHNAVVFIHGCFWHGHDCHLFKWPRTRAEFWTAKIRRNREVDEHAREQLLQRGWRVGVVRECALRGRYRLELDDLLNHLAIWLRSSSHAIEISGHTT